MVVDMSLLILRCGMVMAVALPRLVGRLRLDASLSAIFFE